MKKQLYEVTYWLRQEVNSEEIENKILDKIEKLNFEIYKKIPVKIKNLAYPIAKEVVGQLGTIYFYGTPDKINDLSDYLKKMKEILRFIILKRKVLKEDNLNKTKDELE